MFYFKIAASIRFAKGLLGGNNKTFDGCAESDIFLQLTNKNDVTCEEDQ